MALQVGELFAKLKLDKKPFEEGMGGAEKKFKGFSKIMKGAAAGAAASIGAALTGAVMGADNLQQSLNGLQAQTGATDGEMAGMEESLRNIYANNYGESFQDIADSMAAVEQATGAADGALESLTTEAIKLRDTFGYEVQESAATASTMMKNFGISGEQAMTLIAQGAQKGLDKQGDMLDTFNEYSVYFKQLGFDAEGMFNILAEGAENGAFNLDKVGDAVKEMGIRVKDGSDTSKEAFEALGMDADKMTQQFAAGGETAQGAFQKVIGKLAEMKDPVKQNEVGIALMGTQFEDLEAGAITALANVDKQADMNADTLKDIGNIKYDSLGEAITGIGRQFVDKLFIPIGQKVLPTLNKFAQWANENMPQIKSIISNVLNAVSVAFDGFISTLKFAKQNADILVPSIIAMATVIGATFVPTLYSMAAAATASAAATAVAFAPITIAVAAVGAAVAGLALIWRKWGDDIKRITSEVVEATVGWFTSWWADVKAIFQGLKESLITAWTATKDFVVKIVISFVELIIGRFQTAKDSLSGIITAIKDFFVESWENLKLLVLSIVGVFLSIITGDFEGLKLSLQGIMEAVKRQFSNVWRTIKTVVSEYVKLLVSYVKTSLTRLKNGAVTVLNAVKNFFSNTWRSIKSTVSNMISNMVSTVRTKMTEAKDTIVNIWESAKEFLASIDLYQIGKDIIQGLVNGIKSMAGRVKRAVTDVADNVKGKIKSVLRISSPSKVSTYFGEMFGEGLARGQEKKARKVGQAAAKLAGSAMNGVKGLKADASMDPAATRRAQGAARGDVVTNVTINSPTPHKPSEERRKYEQTQRRLAREWGLS